MFKIRTLVVLALLLFSPILTTAASNSCLADSSTFEAVRLCTAQVDTNLNSVTRTAGVVYAAEDTVRVPDSGDGTSLLRVSVAGCKSYGLGNFECMATVSGGSGEYNYWWMYDGSGQLYQTNSAIVTVTGCTGGGTLRVQVMDRETREKDRSAPFFLRCGGCTEGPGLCDGEFPGLNG